MRDFQLPGRSPVRSTGAMVATSHPLSTQAALDILRTGGNAVDAAVCASAVQAVVEPQSTGIGGDCFVLYCAGGSDKVLALNGSGRSPAAASIDSFRAMGLDAVPTYGPHSVTIPGAIDAWDRLVRDQGRMTLAEVLAPAIHYAEKGYVVHDRVAFDWAEAAGLLSDDEASTSIFLRDGQPYAAGDLHIQARLGATLRTIAEQGRCGFYEGRVAEAIVARLRQLGGVHTLEDFAATACDYVSSVTIDYRGFRVHQMPPNNQGLTALLMLNILGEDKISGHDPVGAERFHLLVEAARLAYRERDRRLAEIDRDGPVVETLLSKDYARRLHSSIDRRRAMTDLPEFEFRRSDTVYISIVDQDRNAISFINSTYHAFGSGITCPETGVVLQNRGSSFRVDPEHPNALAPSKRPMHTIMPGMLTRDGRAVMPFGVMGGDYQPMGNVHFLSNVLDFGMDVQAALDAPRVFHSEGVLRAERGVPAETVDQLTALGHAVEEALEPFGGGQAVWIDWEKGTLTGASDSRKDGMASGF
ncbi:gamma-glutamyltransferase (plasmid) [Rhizobium sp. 32-5/1]|uniref:gamma-glutamyltransferase n=1 Tax=Rhizobium sp. 32-5/1 TaxID=3019602 RepID=UPI00240E288A|nr:gamma-glutamyltransferase [Rhizobium sp. 32-5/1]WEZ85951.1 gamma-glutamyltransferase [Rhizobium sp. 32-5/1]